MRQEGNNRWWEFDSYFGPIEVNAPTEAEAYEHFTRLLKRLFMLSHFIEVAFDDNGARRVERKSKQKNQPPEGGSH